MHTGKGQVLELILENGDRQARLSCPSNLIPLPGQYLLAGDGSGLPLPIPLFLTDSAPQGFIATGNIPHSWNPGLILSLRGPLGEGFSLPLSARNVGLIALNVSPARLRGLIRPALKQDVAVVLVCQSSPDQLPDEVEVQPLSMLQEIVEWADYLAFDVAREDLHQLQERLGGRPEIATGKARVATGASVQNKSQILIQTPIPCGGVAECGICAVTLKSAWKFACKDGPVFDLKELM